MKIRTGAILALLGVLVPAGASFAGLSTLSALVEGDGWDAQLMPGAFDGLLSELAQDNYASRESMLELHAQLNGDGVATAGCVTTVLVADGDTFSLLTLMDGFSGDSDTLSEMRMRSTAPDHAGWFINDLVDRHTVTEVLEGSEDDGPYGDTLQLDADFRWIDGRGDGFAWTGLGFGDTITYDFEHLSGMIGETPEVFKLVGWNGEGWEILDAQSFDEDGRLSYEITLVPAPGAAALLLIAGLVSRGRRRD